MLCEFVTSHYVSHVRCHMSDVMGHVTRITHTYFFNYLFVGLSCGANWRRISYQQGPIMSSFNLTTIYLEGDFLTNLINSWVNDDAVCRSTLAKTGLVNTRKKYKLVIIGLCCYIVQ